MRKEFRPDRKEWVQRASEVGVTSEEIAKYLKTSEHRVQYLRAEEAAKNVEVIYK